MSVRRAIVLTLGLPRDSRTMLTLRELEDGEASLWDRESVLLGLIIERLDALHTTTVKAHGGKVRNKPPEIVPRPKRRPAKHIKPRSTASVLADLDAFLMGGVASG